MQIVSVICMEYQSLCSREIKKNIINLSSDEFAQRMVKVQHQTR